VVLLSILVLFNVFKKTSLFDLAHPLKNQPAMCKGHPFYGLPAAGSE